MNRLHFILAAFTLTFSACHEPERPEPKWEVSSQRVEVEGSDELLFTLPDNFQRDIPIISVPASEAAVAELFQNEAGFWTLRYRSLSGKSGIDHLSVDSENEAAERGEHHRDCKGNPKPKFFAKHPPQKEHKGHYRLNLEVSVLGAEVPQLKKRSEKYLQ